MHYCRLSNCFKAAITEGENWPDDEEATKEDVAATLRSLNEALVKERIRQWGEIKEPEISNDPEAARLQKAGLDLPKTLAERTAKGTPCPSVSPRGSENGQGAMKLDVSFGVCIPMATAKSARCCVSAAISPPERSSQEQLTVE